MDDFKDEELEFLMFDMKCICNEKFPSTEQQLQELREKVERSITDMEDNLKTLQWLESMYNRKKQIMN